MNAKQVNISLKPKTIALADEAVEMGSYPSRSGMVAVLINREWHALKAKYPGPDVEVIQEPVEPEI